MRVFVKNMRGEVLMPCSQRKARILLKEKKAKIYCYNPFTIQLAIATGEAKQECSVGVDTGSKHIGLAITSQDKVLWKGEVELRQDVKENINTKRIYRRSRRNRKTRYRQPRFKNRVRDKGWLPPSIESKVQHTFHWIDKLSSLAPNPKLNIEVGKFDVAKIINPEIQGQEYQEGPTKGFYDVRYFVFARDNYTCQVCGKSEGKKLQTHHIKYRSNGGTNRADNLITVCTDCHTSKNHKEGGILYAWQNLCKKVKDYTEPPFMNILRKRIYDRYPNANITYGSITTSKRKELGLEKTHYNDAIAISGIGSIKENFDNWLLIKQFRKKKRSLHESTPRKGRKEPNTAQKRNSKNTSFSNGWYLGDKIKVLDQIGYISGFTNGGAYVKDCDDNYITLPHKTYKQITFSNFSLLNHTNNWKFIERNSHSSN